MIGLACVAGAMFLLSRLHTGSSNLVIGTDLAVLGIGMGLTLQILILAAQNAAAPADLASTTSGVSFFRNLGGAMGVAAFGAILTNRVADEIAAGFAAVGLPMPSGTSGSLGSPEEISCPSRCTGSSRRRSPRRWRPSSWSASRSRSSGSSRSSR